MLNFDLVLKIHRQGGGDRAIFLAGLSRGIFPVLGEWGRAFQKRRGELYGGEEFFRLG